MTPEARFRKNLTESLNPEWHIQNIESTIQNGIPDVNIAIPNVGEIWLELKATKPALRREQLAWIRKRQILNCPVGVLCKKQSGMHLWLTRFDVNATSSGIIIKTPPNHITKSYKELELCLQNRIIKLQQSNLKERS